MSHEQAPPYSIPPTGAAPLAEAIISDAVPLDTAQLREHPVFRTADPEGQVTDVTLTSAPLNPLDRPHRNEQRIGINHDGKQVGAFNLSQLPSGTTWIRDVKVETHMQGKRMGLAAYLGVIAAVHEVGRQVQSDPHGLSPSPEGVSPAIRVWESLVRRGVASVVEGKRDQHGNPRFISKPPEAK